MNTIDLKEIDKRGSVCKRERAIIAVLHDDVQELHLQSDGSVASLMVHTVPSVSYC